LSLAVHISDWKKTKWDRYALLQVINGDVLKIDLLSVVDISSICEDVDRHARVRTVGNLFPSRALMDFILILEFHKALGALEAIVSISATDLAK
jgi:hypothetical protein